MKIKINKKGYIKYVNTLIVPSIFVVTIFVILLVIGTVSAATFTSGKIYPAVDGTFDESLPNQTFYEMRGGNGDSYGTSATRTINVGLRSAYTLGMYNVSRFYGATFRKDERLNATDTVTSASFCLWPGAVKDYRNLGLLNLSLVEFTPTKDPLHLAAEDYGTIRSVRLAPDFTPSTYSGKSFNCFKLNAAGLNAISKTGYTNLAVVMGNVVDNSTNGIKWSPDNWSSYHFVQASYPVISKRPYLQYTWSSPDVLPQVTSTITQMVTSSVTTVTQTPLPQVTQVTQDYPDAYMNPYVTMIPRIDQGNTGMCSGAAAAYIAMLKRYEILNITPNNVQEPTQRNVVYTIGNITVYSDVHVDYVPSISGIYHDVYAMNSSIILYDIGEVIRHGYNLASDQISPKSGSVEYYYPESEAYLDSHKFNPFSGYKYETSANKTEAWDRLMRNLSTDHAAIIHLDMYSNTKTTPSKTMFPDPVGNPISPGHYVTAIGYNKTENVVYFLHSWSGFQKVGGISFQYWNVSPKSKYLVPYGMKINEINKVDMIQ